METERDKRPARRFWRLFATLTALLLAAAVLWFPPLPGGKAADAEKIYFSAAASGDRVSLSSATQAELEALPGIGPALAAAILDYRAAHGGFSSVEELKQVKGIGEKTFAALRDHVCI